ncbi:hypothetical protein WHR41_09558 [Cladosporium halotolerans]|uniref:Uncharacterized protein n=1 Tax=Cladosporium halotolerans TaxID=1052096 RepID=A0AB34K9L2_9PEZI
MVSLLLRKLNACYPARPLLTTMITNAVLGGIADTAAQTLTVTRRKHVPAATRWFAFLNYAFPVGVAGASSTAAAMKRGAFDQVIFAPGATCQSEDLLREQSINKCTGLACFFTSMAVCEGGDRRAVTRKFQDVYIPTLKADFLIWPAVQMLNYRIMPIQFQVPFVSTHRAPTPPC